MKIRLGLRLMLTGGLFCIMAAQAYAVPASPAGSRIGLSSHDAAIVPEANISNISAETVDASGVPGAEDGPAFSATSVVAGEIVSGIASGGSGVGGAVPIKTLEFDEQFKGDTAPKWVAKSGEWFIAKNAEGENDYLESLGEANKVATVIYDKEFTNFVYRVRMMRSSSSFKLASRIIIRASGAVGDDGHFENEYEFQYSRDGRFSVYGRVGGSSYQIEDWTKSSAVNMRSEWNELSVSANGSRLGFSINGENVWKGRDVNLKKGFVGVAFFRDDVTTRDKVLVDFAILKSYSEPAEAANSLPPHLLTFSIARLLGGITDQLP
jgi:hypothetical protein